MGQSKMNGLWFCQEKGCPTKSSFDCEYALRMHFYDTHLREEEKIFVCEYCNQHFALRTLLNKHVDAAHLKRFQCDWCGCRFGGKDKLKTHTYTHTGENLMLATSAITARPKNTTWIPTNSQSIKIFRQRATTVSYAGKA